MRIAVLGSANSWYLRDLVRAAGDRHQLIPVTFRDVAATVAMTDERFSSRRIDSQNAAAGETVDLRSFDALLVRTMPPGSLEQVVFRMDVLARIESTGLPVINPARAVEAAVDKYLATARLHAAGLPVPRTAVCQTADEALEQFDRLGGDVVLKPLFGSEGRGITRLVDAAVAERAFKLLAQLGSVLYLQEYIEHEGFDLRLLVIGQRVLGMRRRNPLDWRTNISRGATGEPFVPEASLVDMALRAAAAVAAPLAGVDILPGRDGTLHVLEVNAVPGWKGLAAVSQIDVAQLVLEYVAAAVRTQREIASI